MAAGYEVLDRPRLLGWQHGEIGKPAAPHFARCGFARLFCKRIVGHEGGQGFAPVAAFIVDSHRVAPPGMEHLVSQRTLLHERERQDTLVDISKRRETETHRQWARHHMEFAVRIGSDLGRETIEIMRDLGSVAITERGVHGLWKIGTQSQRPVHRLAHHIGPGEHRQLPHRLFKYEAGNGAAFGLPLLHQPSRGNGPLSGGNIDRHVVCEGIT